MHRLRVIYRQVVVVVEAETLKVQGDDRDSDASLVGWIDPSLPARN